MPGNKGASVHHRVTQGNLWRSLVEDVPGQRRGGQGKSPETIRSSPIRPMIPIGTDTLDTEIKTRSSMAAVAENFPLGSILAILR